MPVASPDGGDPTRVATGRAGIALLCHADGVIRQTLRDELGLAERSLPGASFLDLVDPGSASKAAAFLQTVRGTAAAIDWDLNVALDGRPTLLHFAGGLIGEQVLVVGFPSRSEMTDVFEEMMRINNDQATALRAALKEGNRHVQAREARDGRGYDEITRVNNELAALQRELAKKNRELERLVEQQNQFLGMAAHDLRSPLSAIVALSQFLEEEAAPRLDPEQRQFVSLIRSSSRFMVGLIDDLLDISTIEAGRLELHREPTDLRALVRASAHRHRVVAARKGVDVAFMDDAPEPLEAEVDAQRLEQVLDNLVTNAVKFSHPGSGVEVGLEAGHREATLTVRDRGVGMSASQAAALFTPFAERGRRGTADEASTGLGLAIVKRIVEAHGGHIEVASTPGEGTTFRVVMPMVAST